MVEKLSPQILARLEIICRQVRLPDDVNEQVQRELLCHMQDKLLAYLNGEEKLSEADALLLVERHFGDIAMVRDLLQEVHSPFMRPLERFATLIVASSMVHVLLDAWFYFWPQVNGRDGPSWIGCLWRFWRYPLRREV